LWKALITWVAHFDQPLEAACAQRLIDDVLAEHGRGA
jgi:hypothetical protein